MKVVIFSEYRIDRWVSFLENCDIVEEREFFSYEILLGLV